MKDITGKKFGKLTAIKFSHKKQTICDGYVNRKYYWHYKCECGIEIISDRNPVQSGQKSSCGCARGLERNLASLRHFYRGYIKGAEKKKSTF